MTKTKKTANGNTETIENALYTGAETMKDGFEKVSKTYDQMMSFGKDNAEAVIKAATVASKGLETMNGQIFAFARKSFEESITASKAVMSAKSLDEALQLQGEYGKAAFQDYIDEMAKFGEMALSIAKDTAIPLQARASAFAEVAARTD